MQHTNTISNSKTISIIVPVYKVEPYLDECVQSIVDQTYQNLEIILVDDGSPDCCPAICDAWAEKDHRIKVIHKENGGLSDARNAGIHAATGQYVAFVDSDDFVAPEFCKTLLNALLKTGSQVSACQLQKFDEGERLVPMKGSGELRILTGTDALRQLIQDRIRQVVWNKLYCREAIDGILFDVGKYHEDEFWSYQVLGRIEQYTVVDYTGYYYRQRGGSIMGESYSLKRLDAIEAKCRRQEYLKVSKPELAGEGRVNLFFTCLYHGQQVLASMAGEEKVIAMSRLKQAVKDHPLDREDVKRLPFTHRFWVKTAGRSFALCCHLRNLLRVGL